FRLELYTKSLGVSEKGTADVVEISIFGNNSAKLPSRRGIGRVARISGRECLAPTWAIFCILNSLPMSNAGSTIMVSHETAQNIACRFAASSIESVAAPIDV